MKATRVLLSALLVGAAALELSCGDPTPIGVDTRARSPRADLTALPSQNPLAYPSLLTCSPLPYDSVTQTVGPGGGVIQVGAHTLFVPPGSLGDTVTITAVAPSDTVNWVRFQPEGLQLRRPAFLIMSYANCSTLGSLLPKQIAYVSDSLDILDVVKSLDDSLSQTVLGRLKHFSGYAVDW